MKLYNRLSRIVASLGVVALLSALTFMGCTEVDDSLGSEFIPGNQQLKIGFQHLGGCFETRLYRTDSIRTSNIEVGLLGTTRSDTFGLRSAGFYTQYTWGYCPDSTDGFGHRPIFDSIMLGLVVADYGGDTTLVRRYEVYEVLDDSFLQESTDTVFYGNFSPGPYLSSEPLFTFDFPNQAEGIYTTSTAVRMHPTERGKALIRRMMLTEGEFEGNNMEGFYSSEKWVEQFKGLYFKPQEAPAADERGAIYSITLAESGLILYGRNRNETDPTLIQDTTISLYYFSDDNASAGGVSVNTLHHDYANSFFEGKLFEESDEERSLTECCYVEGMGGIVTEITFTESLFEQLEEILATTLDEAGNRYKSLALNQAVLSIYDYETPLKHHEEEGLAPYWSIDWAGFVPGEEMIQRMDASMPRVGLYSSYKGLVGIADYAYVYEASLGALNFGGYLNRSRGCYTMDVSVHLQSLWNAYLKDAEAFMAEPANRAVYLAPEAYSINTFRTMSAQGMADYAGRENSMKLEITYTLIK